jgi:endonuclease/exonuclease/phosphatase family metal-dependent hydrolase
MQHSSGDRSLTFVSWNLHRGRGPENRGAVDPERVFRALGSEIAPLAPHVLAVQEADEEEPPHKGIFDPDRIERITGLRHAHGVDLRWSPSSHGFLGSVLYLSPDIRILDGALIDLPGHAHRGAVLLELEHRDARFTVITAHLSLLQVLRIAQMRTIGQHLARRSQLPLVLLGDLNEWRPWGGLAFSTSVFGRRLAGIAEPTFPIGYPVLPLDRVLVHGATLTETRALKGDAVKAASDHLPLWARVTF